MKIEGIEKNVTVSEKNNVLQYDSVVFTEQYAMEVQGSQVLVRVPRAEIQRIELVYDIGAERPFLTQFCGIVLLIISALPVFHFFSVIMNGGRFPLFFALATGFAVPGVWLVKLSVQKRWVALLDTHKGQRHLIFRTSNDEEAMESFISKVRSQFDYQ
jgi:hypothetical protein